MIEIKNEYKNWTIGENDFQPEYLGKFETIFNLGKVFSCGLIITLVTWIFLRRNFVVFGILHFIGISIILAYPFLKLRYGNLLVGLLFIFLGTYLKGFVYNFYWLVWLGFRPIQFYTVDYFPLLPWFGVVLIGIFFANLLYPDYSQKFQLFNLSSF